MAGKRDSEDSQLHSLANGWRGGAKASAYEAPSSPSFASIVSLVECTSVSPFGNNCTVCRPNCGWSTVTCLLQCRNAATPETQGSPRVCHSWHSPTHAELHAVYHISSILSKVPCAQETSAKGRAVALDGHGRSPMRSVSGSWRACQTERQGGLRLHAVCAS